MEIDDPSSGRVYYYNTRTQETVWERPVIQLPKEETPPPKIEVVDIAESKDEQVKTELALDAGESYLEAKVTKNINDASLYKQKIPKLSMMLLIPFLEVG
jgi:hypothetical protein